MSEDIEPTDDDIGMARKVILNVTAPYEQVVQHRIWEKPIAQAIATARREAKREVLQGEAVFKLVQVVEYFSEKNNLKSFDIQKAIIALDVFDTYRRELEAGK